MITLAMFGSASVSLVPVLVLLGLLMLMDSFKLVRLRAIVLSIGVGGVSALAAGVVNIAAIDNLPLTVPTFSRYLAPVIEEALKAAYLVWLIRKARVGFLVDAAIHGFALGAGFALVENVDYLRSLEGASMTLWFVRGCGTAVLHGGTTAIFGMLAKDHYDRAPGAAAFLPAFVAAAAFHSLFNHFVLPPLMSAVVLLVTLPLLMMGMFEWSERATRAWLSDEFDGDLNRLQRIVAGNIATTQTGRYLESIKDRFAGEVVSDMLCLLHVQLELSIRAKGIMMAREAGLDMPIDTAVRDNLTEWRYLRSQVGRTGLLAMQPLLRGSTRDVWQIAMLQDHSVPPSSD